MKNALDSSKSQIHPNPSSSVGPVSTSPTPGSLRWSTPSLGYSENVSVEQACKVAAVKIHSSISQKLLKLDKGRSTETVAGTPSGSSSSMFTRDLSPFFQTLKDLALSYWKPDDSFNLPVVSELVKKSTEKKKQKTKGKSLTDGPSNSKYTLDHFKKFRLIPLNRQKSNRSCSVPTWPRRTSGYYVPSARSFAVAREFISSQHLIPCCCCC